MKIRHPNLTSVVSQSRTALAKEELKTRGTVLKLFFTRPQQEALEMFIVYC